MRPLVAAALLLPCGPVLSQISACLTEHDSARRLICYDTALAYKAPDIPAKEQPKAKDDVQFIVRDTGNVSSYGGLALGSKPGQISLQRSDGSDASLVKIAGIAVFRPINDLGWQPFAALGWNRDTSGKSPKDVRDTSVGITGPLWDAVDTGWTVVPTARITHRNDIYGTRDGNSLYVNFNLVKLSWVTSVPGPNVNSYSFIPHLGLIAESRTGNGTDQGRWNSAYVGFSLDANLNGLMPRLTSSLLVRRFNDTAAPGINAKRHDRFSSLSVDYQLTDPLDTKVVVRPSLFISREVGADSLAGTPTANKTVIGLRFLIN